MRSKRKKRVEKQRQTLEKIRKFFLYFTMVVIFFVPLIVFYKQVEAPNAAYYLYGQGKYFADFFVYYKSLILQIGSLILFIGALFYRLLDDISFKLDKFEMLLASFGVTVLISLAFSDQKAVAITGYLDRYEGTLTWLAYIALAYSVYTFVKDRVDINKVIGSFVASSFFVSLIGFSQSLSKDFFRTDFGRKLILGSNYAELKDILVFKFPPDRVYSTLFNPNYVGSLIAIAFPLTLYLILEVKNKLLKVALAVVAVMQVLSLAGSKSTTGFVALIVGVIAFGVMQIVKSRADKKTDKKKIYIAVAVVFALLIGVSQTAMVKDQYAKLKRSLTTMNEPVYNTFKSVSYEHPELTVTLENDREIYFKPDGRDLLVYDSNHNEVEKVIGEDSYSFNFSEEDFSIGVTKDEKSAEVTITATNPNLEVTRSMNFHQVFADHFSLRYQLFTAENIKVDTVNLVKNEVSFSGRGYIWNRSLAMIKAKPILGYGADTYTLNFPQIDLVGNAVAIGSQIVDKPHNFYINILTNFGLLGTLAFLALVVYTFRNQYKHEMSVAILAFLVAGLANDSVIFCTYMIFVLFALLTKLKVIEEKS